MHLADAATAIAATAIAAAAGRSSTVATDTAAFFPPFPDNSCLGYVLEHNKLCQQSSVMGDDFQEITDFNGRRVLTSQFGGCETVNVIVCEPESWNLSAATTTRPVVRASLFECHDMHRDWRRRCSPRALMPAAACC